MYIHIRVYMYIFAYVYIFYFSYAGVHACIFASFHECVLVYACLLVCVCVYVHVHMCAYEREIVRVLTYLHTRKHPRFYTHINTVSQFALPGFPSLSVSSCLR